METEGCPPDICTPAGPPPERWNHIRKLLERSSPFCHPDFTPSTDNLSFLQKACRVLVVGAGGLGCELLKNLVLLGFSNVHVIDMDIIDISNLNRQFLFRKEDVGKPKAEVAAAFINGRIQGAKVVPHYCKIQDKFEDFYKSFHIIVCGLDSIEARRWLNAMIVALAEIDTETKKLKEDTIIPMIDGGTEGFKGSARVIIPRITPCIECTIDLYPPAVTYPLCTIATTPRLPEHCIEYARIILWTKENPFQVQIDGDDPAHISWIYEKASERANQFGITGVNYRLTQGVVKNIIPAVASTNAVVAAVCSTEVFKIVTSCCLPLQNYMVFSDIDGIYSYSFEGERKENCSVCSGTTSILPFDGQSTLQEVVDFLIESPDFQMKAPDIYKSLPEGKTKALYAKIFPHTSENLRCTLLELELKSEDMLLVADSTRPAALTAQILFPK